MNTSLTPSEIAEIKKKAEQLYPVNMENYTTGVPHGMYGSCDSNYYERKAYIAAACEYAAEIKRLREGIDQGCKYWSISSNVRNHFKQLLNSQP